MTRAGLIRNDLRSPKPPAKFGGGQASGLDLRRASAHLLEALVHEAAVREVPAHVRVASEVAGHAPGLPIELERLELGNDPDVLGVVPLGVDDHVDAGDHGVAEEVDQRGDRPAHGEGPTLRKRRRVRRRRRTLRGGQGRARTPPTRLIRDLA